LGTFGVTLLSLDPRDVPSARRTISVMNLHVRERGQWTHSTREAPTWIAPLIRAQIEPVAQACCCPAPAVYAVVVAPNPELSNPPEVLLCAHHMWQSRERLARRDVGVYDAAGCLVDIATPVS
jgi:hypothetical protein